MTESDLEARLRRLERAVRRRDLLAAALVATIAVLACGHETTAPAPPTSLTIGGVAIGSNGITIKGASNTLALSSDQITLDSGDRHGLLRADSVTVASGNSQGRLSTGPAMLQLRASDHDRLVMIADGNQASIHGEVSHGEHFGALASAVDAQAVVLAGSKQKSASIYAKGAEANTAFETVK